MVNEVITKKRRKIVELKSRYSDDFVCNYVEEYRGDEKFWEAVEPIWKEESVR